MYEKPNTINLGMQSRNAAAELEAIISSRNHSSRALPALTASPALVVGHLAGNSWGSTQQQVIIFIWHQLAAITTFLRSFLSSQYLLHKAVVILS